MANLSDPLDRAFHALADPSRRAIVARLVAGTATVSALAQPLAMSLPSVVQHLKVLEDAGLIKSEKQGRVRTCRIDLKALRLAERWIATQRAEWEDGLEEA